METMTEGLHGLAALGDPVAQRILERKEKIDKIDLSPFDKMQLRYFSCMNYFKLYDPNGDIYPSVDVSLAMENLEQYGLTAWSDLYRRYFITTLGWAFIKEHNLYNE